MTVQTGLNKKQLTQGERFYAYSGVVVGDVSVPATFDMIELNVGLRDAFVKIQPFFGKAVSTTNGHQIGIIIQIDGVEILKSQPAESAETEKNQTWEYFVPKQSTLKVISLNHANNNTQERGVNLLGWYL